MTSDDQISDEDVIARDTENRIQGYTGIDYWKIERVDLWTFQAAGQRCPQTNRWVLRNLVQVFGWHPDGAQGNSLVCHLSLKCMKNVHDQWQICQSSCRTLKGLDWFLLFFVLVSFSFTFLSFLSLVLLQLVLKASEEQALREKRKNSMPRRVSHGNEGAWNFFSWKRLFSVKKMLRCFFKSPLIFFWGAA